jgi:hypothetical protein
MLLTVLYAKLYLVLNILVMLLRFTANSGLVQRTKARWQVLLALRCLARRRPRPSRTRLC